MKEKHDDLAWPLDPLMEMLMRFESEAQLAAMVAHIFQAPLPRQPRRACCC